ncbi:MAG: hypothetical protein ACE5H7_13545 [Acidiferrobacterales bacterium]
MRNISKRLFLNTLTCETLGWIQGNQNFAEQTFSIGEKFLIEEGIEIGERAVARLVDLHRIIQKNFYQNDFHGSTSIKKVLPVLVPNMSYEALQIADGETAIAAFANLAKRKYEPEEAETTKEGLLNYCKQDTLAMVKLHARLDEHSG